MTRTRIAPLVALNLGIVYLGWGSTYPAIRVMVRSVPPLLGAGLRFALAGLIVLAIARWRIGPEALRVSRRQVAAAALVGFLLPAGGNGVVTIAELHVPAGLAALIIALVPIWVVLIGTLLGTRPAPLALAGVGLGFVGVAALLLSGGSTLHASTVGMLLVALAALSWATGSVLSPRLPLPRTVWTSIGIEMLAGGMLMTIVGLAIGEASGIHHLQTGSLEGLAWLIVFGSVVTYSAYVWLLGNAPISLVSTYAFVNPVVAVVIGVVLLSERVTPSVAAGAALIVFAVGLITASLPRDRSAAQQPVASER